MSLDTVSARSNLDYIFDKVSSKIIDIIEMDNIRVTESVLREYYISALEAQIEKLKKEQRES